MLIFAFSYTYLVLLTRVLLKSKIASFVFIILFVIIQLKLHEKNYVSPLYFFKQLECVSSQHIITLS